ncbi:MAG: PilC/PilY family type IV pilus protein, partial [Steroidobacteraceae bacterium]|nr:PilC/PilY family type IV pilus protein [Steroidobacteraceae bacterium]
MAAFRRINLLASLAGCVFAAGLVAPPAVVADDIEVFFSTPVDATAKPNILFILDTSQSMFTVESAAPDEPYDPEKDYTGVGDCDSAAYYWTSGTGAVPSCAAGGWAKLSAAQFACPAWAAAVETGGFFTKISRIAQDDGSAWVGMSQYPNQQSLPTVCEGDGATPTGLNWSRKNKGKDVYPSLSYTVYDGNYLNWASQSSGDKYRIDLIREAVGEVIANTEGIKVGMMRYGYDGARVFEKNTPNSCIVEPNPVEDSRSSNGAPIIFPVTDLDGPAVSGFPLSKDVRTGETDVRSQLRYQLGIDANNSVIGWEVDPSLPDADQEFQIVKGGGSTCPIPLFTPGGRSPIAGGMYEAYLYFSGLQWSQKYGKQAALGSTFDYPSVVQSRVGSSEIYKSPVVDTCAKNFIVLLSDGTTEQDNDVDGPVQQLPGFNTTVGKSCDPDPYLDVTGTPPPSQCVDDMAEHMLGSDLRPNTAVPGVNNVNTYTVGFKLGSDTNANAARQLLQETADRGGGQFYEAGNAVELKDMFGKIVREILTLNTSFSAPAVTVNAFNRTQNLNDLYMALFRPAFNYRWTGNIKKYQLDPLDGDILDANNKPAVDPGSGFFFNNARSFWSATADGSDITAGGAAGLIEYTSRKVKTTSLLDGSTVNLNTTGLLTDAQLGIQVGDFVKPGVATSGLLTAAALVEWLYGKDVADEDADTITAESRYDMGDPLHAKPITVIYGGTVADPDLNDDALFAVTNDGVLHAFDPSSDSGEELWAFIPRDQLSRTRNLYYNRNLVDPEDRGYGLDGNIRVIRIDNNRNGIIETASPQNDRVYLYFGQRRGGQKYYAFDVSNKNAPRLMWSRDYSGDLAGQAWSAPQPARVRVGTTAMDVLIFGGGYDTTQDGATYAEDSVGRGIYMVDALDGDLIWRAGPDSGANLRLTAMKHSIPGDVRVVDLTGDGFADRIYAADLGGRIWRFDIFNGQSATGT